MINNFGVKVAFIMIIMNLIINPDYCFHYEKNDNLDEIKELIKTRNEIEEFIIKKNSYCEIDNMCQCKQFK